VKLHKFVWKNLDITVLHLCSYKCNTHKGIPPLIEDYINEFKVPDFSLPPRCSWVLRSSEMLSGAGWYLVTHYQPTPRKFPEDRSSQWSSHFSFTLRKIYFTAEIKTDYSKIYWIVSQIVQAYANFLNNWSETRELGHHS
jgi:hypothetical protein